MWRYVFKCTLISDKESEVRMDVKERSWNKVAVVSG